ncbi:MAG: rhomboid family intramembrane serine protease [Nitrospirota bacterium]
MIPYKDDNPTEKFPFVTIALIALNVLVFLWQATAAGGFEKTIFSYGAVPSSILDMKSSQPLHPGMTIFTAMFMHAGLLHVGGNMLYLWIFGNNIEDRLGHFSFLLFYLAGGVVAAYAHALSAPHSDIPMVGASGAVAAVLGAYLLLYPRAGVYTLLFLGFFVQVVRLPALIVIGFWAIIQFINGAVSRGSVPGGGVAWFAHIGGFVFGLVVVKVFLMMKGSRRKGYEW